MFDALIAAAALAAGVGVATRDIAGFEDCGLPALVDPWRVDPGHVDPGHPA